MCVCVKEQTQKRWVKKVKENRKTSFSLSKVLGQMLDVSSSANSNFNLLLFFPLLNGLRKFIVFEEFNEYPRFLSLKNYTTIKQQNTFKLRAKVAGIIYVKVLNKFYFNV